MQSVAGAGSNKQFVLNGFNYSMQCGDIFRFQFYPGSGGDCVMVAVVHFVKGNFGVFEAAMA